MNGEKETEKKETEKKEEEEEEKTPKTIKDKKKKFRVFYSEEEDSPYVAYAKVYESHVKVCQRFEFDVPARLKNKKFYSENSSVHFKETSIFVKETFEK